MFYQILSAVWEVHSPFSLISDANKFASVNSGAKLKKNPSIKGRHKGIRKVYLLAKFGNLLNFFQKLTSVRFKK